MFTNQAENDKEPTSIIQSLETPEMFSLYSAIMNLSEQAKEQQKHIVELEQKFMELQQNHVIPESNLFHESYLKRAFAIFGHWIVAYLIIAIPLMILALLSS